eukprot:CAMPEP_0115841450 /NCGR_PEP_ID=MMETSP0287-20121206/7295_1 /TAXON_ID=412157 /ORGANISM="Chrysochromulina rotalis, Strain UIO044" /LENGTH=88 /DNA_ID=CAMNT_0003295097 /DNA_START=244 /DNA_END=511 /DNA_ORIENTATION=-
MRRRIPNAARIPMLRSSNSSFASSAVRCSATSSGLNGARSAEAAPPLGGEATPDLLTPGFQCDVPHARCASPAAAERRCPLYPGGGMT